jgi:hypothetical protein
VQLSSGNSGGSENDHTLTFTLNNAGTGPARIYRFEFIVDGRPMPGQDLAANIARACCSAEYQSAVAGVQNPYDVLGVIQTRRITTTMLAANEEATAMRWPRNERNAALWDAIDRARQSGRLSMHACYCSVFDECWDAQSSALPVRRAQVCEEPPPNPGVSN